MERYGRGGAALQRVDPAGRVLPRSATRTPLPATFSRSTPIVLALCLLARPRPSRRGRGWWHGGADALAALKRVQGDPLHDLWRDSVHDTAGVRGTFAMSAARWDAEPGPRRRVASLGTSGEQPALVVTTAAGRQCPRPAARWWGNRPE
ncbi:hypothetical protein Krad_2292 [Kineococcus radiotolerans SRS30216 = ATCC BAA-149]|uniref:Uncharacterized protein n=1 Tax=Kineococcus radiotolerans (strain ATCC BAA-149 / DSM 14245 / SRS30216) TaxID=266940 RepID=A6WAD4_KINRD|nr:hypothetical protein Krad_2292 [Kineococcus radiotolerans SRS30216 = ATCC BAA-149]